ncbi:MAG: glycosyltransferase family 9 protein [Thermodesulfobacteriota bacterium]
MFSYQIAPRSLCLLRLSAIGDVTHVLPTLRTLQYYWPETAVTWIIGKTEASLLSDIPGVEFVVFDKDKGIKAFLELGNRLKNRSFDLFMNMQGSYRAALCSRAVKSSYKLDFASFGNGSRSRSIFGKQPAQPKDRQHVLDGFLEFPRLFGLEPVVLRWDLPIPERDMQFANSNMPEGRDYLVVNPCSSVRFRNYRNWNVNSYASVIENAAGKYGLQTVLTGGPTKGERDFASAICSCTDMDIVNLVGQTTLKQLAAVLSRARVVISPDTGCAHIANAVGTPVVGLYATSNPERTGPYLCRDITVNRYPDAVYKEFGTTPDNLSWGKRVRSREAMNLITVQDVLDNLDRALDKDMQSNTG